MLNMNMKVTGTGKTKKLVIEVDLSQTHGTSGSGKSTIIASSQGNQQVPDTDGVKIGLNVYKPVK